MIKSIKYFEENCITKFEDLENKFLKNPAKIAEYVIGLTAELSRTPNDTGVFGTDGSYATGKPDTEKELDDRIP